MGFRGFLGAPLTKKPMEKMENDLETGVIWLCKGVNQVDSGSKGRFRGLGKPNSLAMTLQHGYDSNTVPIWVLVFKVLLSQMWLRWSLHILNAPSFSLSFW